MPINTLHPDPSRRLLMEGLAMRQRDADTLQQLPAIQNGVDTGAVRTPSGYLDAFRQAAASAHEPYVTPPRAPAGQVTAGWWNRVGPGGVATLRGNRAGGIEGPMWQNIRAQNQEIARRRAEAADRVQFLGQPGAAAAFMGYQDPAPSYMNQLAAAVKLAEVGMNDEAQQVARAGLRGSGLKVPATPASALQMVMGAERAKALSPEQMTPDKLALEMMGSQAPLTPEAMREGLQALIENGYAYKPSTTKTLISSGYQDQGNAIDELNNSNAMLVQEANKVMEEQRKQPTEEGLAKLSKLAELLRKNTAYRASGAPTMRNELGDFTNWLNRGLFEQTGANALSRAVGSHVSGYDDTAKQKVNYLMEQLGLQ